MNWKLLTPDQAVAGPTVYLLRDGANVLYVGRSKRLRLRLQQHRLDGRIKFDNILYFVATQHRTATKLEIELIKRLRPRHNVHHCVTKNSRFTLSMPIRLANWLRSVAKRRNAPLSRVAAAFILDYRAELESAKSTT
jgi:excinuclease UvrABC nuclease subunit